MWVESERCGIELLKVDAFIIMGIIMYSYYHGCDPVKAGIVSKPDHLMPRFVQDVTGHIPGMAGIFISCIFGATLSHVSASLHAVSGIIYNDFIRPLILFAHIDTLANRSMRIIILLLGTECFLAGFLVEHFKSIFQIKSVILGTTTGAKLGVFTVGMLCPWANLYPWFVLFFNPFHTRRLNASTFF